MKDYEYRFEEALSLVSAEAAVKKASKEGWEIVSHSAANKGFTFVLRREK